MQYKRKCLFCFFKISTLGHKMPSKVLECLTETSLQSSKPLPRATYLPCITCLGFECKDMQKRDNCSFKDPALVGLWVFPTFLSLPASPEAAYHSRPSFIPSTWLQASFYSAHALSYLPIRCLGARQCNCFRKKQ